MSGEINYDTGTLAQSAKTIEAELTQFSQTDRQNLTNTIDALNKMNASKGAGQLAKALTEMGDIDVTAFTTKLDQYSKSSAFTGMEMQRTDVDLAKGYQEGS